MPARLRQLLMTYVPWAADHQSMATQDPLPLRP